MTPSSPPSRGINPLRSLRAHRWLAALILVGVGAAGLPVSLWKGKPTYYAECVIYISPTFMRNLQEDKEVRLDSTAQYQEFVQQNARTMNRYDIVYDALQRLGKKRFTWQQPGESDRRAAERLQGALEIQPVPDTYQVTIGLEDYKPDGLSDIVNTIGDVYVQKERGEDFYASDRRIASLRQERAKLTADIEQKDAERGRISQELAVSSFSENFENPYDRLIQDAKESLASARQKRYEAESQFGAIDPTRPDSKATLSALAMDQAARDSALISLESNLNQRRSLLLAQISGLAPAHPGRKAIEREIAEIDAQLKEKNAELVAEYGKSLLEQRRAEVYKTRRVEDALAADVAKESGRASEFSRDYQRGMALGRDIDTDRKRLDAIDERINFLSLESEAPGFARIFSYARPVDVPIKSSRRKIFVVFFAGALFLALAVPLAVDFLDPRIHTMEDAERVLGFAPIAWVAERKQGTPEFIRDQMLRVAAGIQHDADAAGTHYVVLTSPQPGGGTTTLALSVGEELARLGVKVLVVEANAFHPDARYPRGAGFAQWLEGKGSASVGASLNGTPREFHVPAIGAGDTGGQRHLPNLKRFREVLKERAGNFDVVLMDAPPLALSADSELLARAGDLVLLVVEAEALTRSDLVRAARWLERAQPKAVGAILNRVRLAQAGGYYRTAVQEFASGERQPESALVSPWLWK
jgi:Mrp family chromosome partitioning ATPase/capsular polysaccharide biosynthesis protein